jgi:outer membrane protein OmpA-like peptidoglycan-associated protein
VFAAKVDRLHFEHVAIAGYTDSSGDRALNLALSLQRGRSVSQFLATRFAELHVSISLSVRGGGVTHVSTSAARDRVVVVTT